SQPLRAALLAAVRRAGADPQTQAMVILCAGRTFIAGADVGEFDRPPEEPHLPELTQAIESAGKPVVAALHGTALGGGFEIALASHYRIATADSKVGLPEVKLGVIPGAGGTQRLPRLVGVEAALRMIVGGEPVSAGEALTLGAIDEIATGDLTGAALAAASRLVAQGGAPRRTAEQPLATVEPAIFDAARRQAAVKQRHLLAPLAAIEAIEAAVTQPFAKSVQRER
ncbi:MAG: enoyl-CoA hydratase/isomerase family protein, partial [Candidatus Obscuribacter sp.]|nr:enoyl-CoA hydratase/isomerase family protein [Candidatus Obscuribacter sp.]